MAVKAMIAFHQTLQNHAGDKDLQKLLGQFIEQGQQESKQFEGLLLEIGVGLPPTPPERPKASVEEIPAGARVLDNEIGMSLLADVGAGLIACSSMMAQCIREDIAIMFGQIHTEKATLAAKTLRLNKEKGWLVPPPLHIQLEG